MTGKKKEKPEAKEHEKKKATHIPLVPMRSDKDELEDDLKDIFEEDQVTHRHGSSEPERD